MNNNCQKIIGLYGQLSLAKADFDICLNKFDNGNINNLKSKIINIANILNDIGNMFDSLDFIDSLRSFSQPYPGNVEDDFNADPTGSVFFNKINKLRSRHLDFLDYNSGVWRNVARVMLDENKYKNFINAINRSGLLGLDMKLNGLMKDKPHSIEMFFDMVAKSNLKYLGFTANLLHGMLVGNENAIKSFLNMIKSSKLISLNFSSGNDLSKIFSADEKKKIFIDCLAESNLLEVDFSNNSDIAEFLYEDSNALHNGIAKYFYNAIKKSKIKRINFSMIPKNFVGWDDPEILSIIDSMDCKFIF